MKIVIDTNVVISGIFWKGPSNEILRLIETKDNLQFVQSPETYKELEEVIKRGKFAEIIKKRKLNIDTILESLVTICRFYHISTNTIEKAKREVSIEDADDLKFIELAIEAEADFIISGDPHLIKIRKYQNIKILKPREFLEKFLNEK
ncbi:MAG: putative toxin-antitoxin system toxin component, PIN family [Candidatus Aminicenantes bacterium]|nr:MAG: putative toxin-antitoxin system toxin component, PIN family [Candidatus Aminicenantes bacterium]